MDDRYDRSLSPRRPGGPTPYSTEKAKQGDIVLKKGSLWFIFIAGLVGGVALAFFITVTRGH